MDIEKVADALFDDYVCGQEPAIGTIMDTLEASDRWHDLADGMRAAYYRENESRQDKALRVLRAYERFMDDICERIAKDGE